MIINSKYTKIFQSHLLTKEKYNELYNIAIKIRDIKNEISEEVNKNLYKYLNMSKFEFEQCIRTKNININSCFYIHLADDIYTCYQHKFKSIIKKISFNKIKFIKFDLYQRNTTKHKKGELKRVINKEIKSDLTIVLTYLTRYGSENILNYIKEQLKIEKDASKTKFYNNILDKCNKFTFERLYKLALQKRERIISEYNKVPIKFKSLTFRGRSRKNLILDYNKNYNSLINAFISLSGFSHKSFDIPVKFSKDYHGNIKQYNKKSNDYEYTITFNSKRKIININLCIDGERYIPENKNNLIGIDVNVKHNLFSLSDGTTYDYDRKLLKDYCDLQLHIDDLKEKNKNYQIGKRLQNKVYTIKNKIIKHEQNLISNMMIDLKKKNIDHIVLEDLQKTFNKSYIKDKNNSDINFNRVSSALSLSNLKNEIEHIAYNYDICVSTIHPYYTSRQCPICGCIDEDNRQNQEDFHCINCDHHDNADHNAAINIKNRVSETVLQNKLLKQLDNGSYEPKKIKKDKVYDILLSFRKTDNLSERSISNYI